MSFWLPSTFPAPDMSVMPYFVYLTDAAQVAALQAAYPEGLTGLSPTAAGLLYSAPIYAPSIQSTTWIGTALAGGVIPPATFWVNNLFYAYNVNVASGVATSTDPDYSFAPAPYAWVGFFRFWNTEPGEYSQGKRRWVDGFELPQAGEGGSGVLAQCYSRDASRTDEGIGYAQRSRSSGATKRHDIVEAGGSVSPYSWEILYIRLRRLPAANVNFWRAYGSSSPSSGAALYITPTGAIAGYNINNFGAVDVLFGTSAVLNLNQWYRLDIRVAFNLLAPVCPIPGTPTGGTFSLFVDEAAAFSGTAVYTCAVAGVGIGAVQNHSLSTVGNSFVLANDLEIDIDDWINIAPVTYSDGVGPSTILFPPTPGDACLDWQGHHVQAVRATAYAASHDPLWVGDWRALLQNPPEGADVATNVVTNSPSIQMAIETDYLDQQGGCPAMEIGVFNSNANGVGTGYQLGYNFAGAGAVLTAIPIVGGTITAGTWQAVLYSVNPGIVPVTSFSPFTPTNPPDPPPAHAPVQLIHVNAATAQTKRIVELAGAAEYLGVWGPEDIQPDAAPGVTPPTSTGVHNAPYIATQWGTDVPLPLSAVAIHAGVYTGDSFGQDVQQAFPAHWWWVRPLTVGTKGTRWWSTFLSAHRGLQRGTIAGLMVQALVSAGQALLRLVGANADSNQSAVSYQWIAVSDSGMRFLLNGAFAHQGATAATQTLIDASFLPEAAFFQDEAIGGNSTPRCWYKGIGHPTDRASLLTAADQAGVVTLNTGSLALQSPLWVDANTSQTAFGLWRRLDGSGKPGNVLDLVTWTGDGTGARTIACDLGDRSPLFALVCPHDGQSWVRDPSHTGSNSVSADFSTTSTTRIVGGGINQVLVGTDLNALGVVYDLFVLPGLPAVGTWSPNPPDPHIPIFPVAPNPAPGDQWGPSPPLPLDTATGVQTFGNGTDSGGGDGCANLTLPPGTDSQGVVCH